MPADPAHQTAASPQLRLSAPGHALSPWVECYWALSASQAPLWRSRVLPDGSNDIILDFAGTLGAFVVGAMRRADVVPLNGRVDLLGVRFRPGAALPFLGVPLSELTDRQVALEEVWGRAGDSLVDAVASAPQAERVARLERALAGRRERESRDITLAARAVALLRQTRGGIPVTAAAAALGIGARRLERLFDRAVGLSPKRLARVLRFRYAARRVGQVGARGGAALAVEAGYADQAHFIREFKTLAGLTPAQYAAERRVGFVQDEPPTRTEIGRTPNQEPR
jgi:methylphosphotriester-DNA--protein-cysteine methyltransferase